MQARKQLFSRKFTRPLPQGNQYNYRRGVIWGDLNDIENSPILTQQDHEYNFSKAQFGTQGFGTTTTTEDPIPTFTGTQLQSRGSTTTSGNMQALATVASNAPNVLSLGTQLLGNYINAKATKYTADKQLEGMQSISQATNNQTELQRDMWDRSWKAAKDAGLLSPDQFSSGSSNYGQFSGRTISSVPRTSRNTVYTLN